MAGEDYERWRGVLAGERLPCALVDLDAVDANLDTLLAAIGERPLTLRPATKSVRVPELLRYIAQRAGARAQGLMTYSAAETAWLAQRGFDDFLLAYPVGRAADASLLADAALAGATIRVAVDHPDHVTLLGQAARDKGCTLDLCIDIDASWRPLAGRLHLGVRRSPIRDSGAALRLAALIAATPGVRLSALLAYEAQVAGVRETNPGSRHLDPVRRFIKSRSKPVVAARRAEVVSALKAAGHALEVVNGGGTGSLASTSRDPSCTEVSAGSGVLCPHLFDGYRGLELRPAMFFAVGVVRCSDPDHVTCFGGGYSASGAPGVDRQPIVHLPRGLQPIAMEGFGEVQTPFLLRSGAPRLALGDPVICRHAKAGELTERFTEVLLIRGEAIVARAPTYRGLGQAFG